MLGKTPSKDKQSTVYAYKTILDSLDSLLAEISVVTDASLQETLSKLPEFHEVQQRIEDNKKRFAVIACGRRVGKTTYILSKIIKDILDGKQVGLMLPDFKYLNSIWRYLEENISKGLVDKSNFNEKVLRLTTGGSVRIHSAEKPDSPRGEKYHAFYIDETSLISNLEDIWDAIIRPTLVDFEGTCMFTGTPKGKNYFYTLYQKHLSDPEWSSFSSPTISNPFLPESERNIIASLPKSDKNKQEYYAEFIDDGGEVFGELPVISEYDEHTSFRIGIDLAKSRDFTVVSVFNQNNQQVFLERWNQMDWNSIVTKIIKIVDKYPNSSIIVDNTGVGSPIVDRLEEEGYEVIRFNFTESSRTRILENMALMIDNKEVEFLDDEIQKAEFEAFGRYIKNGKVKLLSNIHDDTVMAAGMALDASPPFIYQGLIN
jgi:hypothetical protein